MKKLIYIIAAFFVTINILCSQASPNATFTMHLKENPLGTYTMQLKSTSDNNTDVKIYSGDNTALKVKIPVGITMPSPTGNWTVVMTANDALITNVCGTSEDYDLIEYNPTDDIALGNIPDGSIVNLFQFTVASELGKVYAFEDHNPPESDCIVENFANELQVDLNGTNTVKTQEILGSTTLYTAQPIELVSFYASKYDNSSSLLKWKGQNQINFDRFELQRSYDSQKWEHVINIKDKQNDKDLKKYSYIDKNIYDGKEKTVIYYRLKMIDRDDQYKYSKIESILFLPYIKQIEIEVFPNPSSKVVFFKLTGTKTNSNLNIMIFDNKGKLVLSKSEKYNSNKNLLLDKNSMKLDNGIYNLIITDENNSKYYTNFILTR